MIDILEFAITDVFHLLVTILIILTIGFAGNITLAGLKICDYIFLDKSNGKVIKGDKNENE